MMSVRTTSLAREAHAASRSADFLLRADGTHSSCLQLHVDDTRSPRSKILLRHETKQSSDGPQHEERKVVDWGPAVFPLVMRRVERLAAPHGLGGERVEEARPGCSTAPSGEPLQPFGHPMLAIGSQSRRNVANCGLPCGSRDRLAFAPWHARSARFSHSSPHSLRADGERR